MSASAACVSWIGEPLAELHARPHARDRLVERAPRHADRRGADRRAEDVERAEREAEPLPHFADERDGGDAAAVHDEAAERVIAARRDRLEREPRARRLDEERADAFFACARGADRRLAKTTKWCAMPTFEMKPSRRRGPTPSPSRRAVVRIDATSLPASGSVSAKPPTVFRCGHAARNARTAVHARARTSGCEPSPCTAKIESASGET